MFFDLLSISIGNLQKITSFHQSTHNQHTLKMSNIDTINAYKSKMAMSMNSQLFKGDVLVHKKGRGEIKWVATPETLDIVFGNLKRSIHSRTPMAELTNLFTSIEQNKFATQIKTFTKFYTNPQYSSSDINLGSCPQLDKKIPYNIHKQDKEYFITLILNWYEKYYLWKQKNKAPSKPPRHTGTNENSSKIVPLVSEAIPVAEGWQEVQGAEIPDSWDNDSEEGETAIAPESWENIVEEDL